MSDPGEKIFTLEELGAELDKVRESGKSIAQCHGVFDLLHPGHMRHINAASTEADLLVVTITADRFVSKGPGRPVFNQRLRAESLAALEAVDYVAIVDFPTAVEAVGILKPDVYVKGSDYARAEDDLTGKIVDEEDAVRAVGGKIRFTDEVTFSSTTLLNSYFAVFSPEADTYLREMRKGLSSEDVVEKLKALDSMKVLVLGDIIIDEYHFCKAMGKPSKSATISANFLSSERHAGGALAVANHLAGFTPNVHLLTYLGDPAEEEAFVREHLKPDITVDLVPHPGRPVVVKRRYVDPFQVSKMFEVQWVDCSDPEPEPEERLTAILADTVKDYDLVLVADFGHGSVGARTIELLSSGDSFLAVNAQTNSANMGYNMATKYPRADYLCLDEEEIRMASHDREGDLAEMVAATAERIGCSMVSVTRGRNGSLTWSRDGGVRNTPIFSTEVVDSVGAGDAYLSVTSLCARAGYDPALVGFVGNCVGALAVRIVGNREPVEPVALYKFITTLLK